jgi:RecB family exonuclease
MAAMAARGAFPQLGAVTVADAAFVGLGAERKFVLAPLADLPPDRTWAELVQLLARWMDPARGYSARMAAEKEGEENAFDHLARFGEWDHTTPVTPVDLS